MAEPIREYFTRLTKEHQPVLRSFTGVVRFDLKDGERTEHWYVRIRKGDVTVSHKGPEPDCVLSGDRATFEAIVSGKMNAMAAVLRGALDVNGKMILLAALQRLFPGSPGATGQPTAGYARQQS